MSTCRFGLYALFALTLPRRLLAASPEAPLSMVVSGSSGHRGAWRWQPRARTRGSTNGLFRAARSDVVRADPYAAQVLTVELPCLDLVVWRNELAGLALEKVFVDCRAALAICTA